MEAIQIQPQVTEIPKTTTARSSSRKPQSHPNKIYDLVCVGFGTAALGLAVALQSSDIKDNVLFLESRSHFEQDANSDKKHMVTCFAQDLATLRDPTSKFTFLNYLHSKEKLETFMSLFAESPYPLREDFNDYLTWSASQFAGCVRYQQEVTTVSPVSDRKIPLNLWSVTSRDVTTQETRVFAARNVIVATGGEARVIQHSSNPTSEEVPASAAMQMLQVTDAVQELCKPNSIRNDERFANLAKKSDGVLDELFYEEPFEMMRAML